MRRVLTLLLSAGLLWAWPLTTVAAQSGDDAGSRRVDVPEAGIAIAFPDDLSVNVVMERMDVDLPAEWESARPAYVWTVLSALAPDGSGCQLAMYEDHPLTIAEHVAFIGDGFLEEAGSAASFDAAAVTLPAGAATRMDLEVPGDVGFYGTGYIIESDTTRYQLRCFGDTPSGDAWRSVAETIEFLGAGDADAMTRSAGAAPDVISGFRTYVPVADPGADDFPAGALMSADCEIGLHIVAEDGSATELLSCVLSDDPVEPRELQGSRPATLVTYTAGECTWSSDYWSVATGAFVPAATFEVVVTPEGRVYARSTYPAEPLECAGA